MLTIIVTELKILSLTNTYWTDKNSRQYMEVHVNKGHDHDFGQFFSIFVAYNALVLHF